MEEIREPLLESEGNTFYKYINININYKKSHFLIFLLNIFFTIAFLVFLNAAQVGFITTKVSLVDWFFIQLVLRHDL